MSVAVRFEQVDSVGHIVLGAAPENLVSLAYAEALTAAVHEAGVSDSRVLLVRNEGENFSCGGAVKEWPGKNQAWFRTFVGEVHRAYRAIEALPIPTVAAVRGNAWGGGFELVLACDVVVAAEDAMLWAPEAVTGFVPIAGGVQRLAAALGPVRAAWMVMMGEPLTGADAKALGLIAQAVPDDQLDTRAGEIVAQLAQGPTKAYAAAKTLLKVWSNGGIAAADAVTLDATMDLYGTRDAQYGIGVIADVQANGRPIPQLTFEGS